MAYLESALQGFINGATLRCKVIGEHSRQRTVAIGIGWDMNRPPPRKGEFVIYRPATTSNRLEDYLFKKGQWAPSQSYEHRLWDVTNQMTPAEAYRHRLATDGKLIRILQRLEWRWQKEYELWWRCSLAVQSGYRGMLGRRYFNSVKEKLMS